MRTFDEIFAIAANRKGGSTNLEELMKTGGMPTKKLSDMTDDRWLAIFSQHVFSAGFNWKVIENKWPGFEEAFHGFAIGKCAMMDDAWFDELVQDTRIVRHGGKIQSVRDNAVMLQELAKSHGSAAKAIADWPDSDYVGLLAHLKTHGSRLGGNTGAYSLRHGGKPSFILSKDVVARLIAEGVIEKAPTGKGAMAKVQEAFNTWQAQSGRSLTEISRVLALSV